MRKFKKVSVKLISRFDATASVKSEFVSNPSMILKTKRHPTVSFLFWRRWRDLNPRAGCPTYRISNPNPSASWVHLQIYAYNFNIIICICQ